MLTLCRIDAAFRRLQAYDPDLDVALLSADDAGRSEFDRREAAQKMRVIRITLVARIADIGTLGALRTQECLQLMYDMSKVKQASAEPASLDVAVAMTVILISTYENYIAHGESPGGGHKHAMQAIQLLASIYQRFSEAIDLFFDLVERSCAQNRAQGKIQHSATKSADAHTTRMMQNYDQMLLKLISKHWIATGPLGNWDIFRALERIQGLRDVYEVREDSRAMIFSLFKRRDPSAFLFGESSLVLRKINKQRIAGMVTAATKGRVFLPRMPTSKQSLPNMRSERISHESSSSGSKSLSFDVKDVHPQFHEPPEIKEMNQTFTRMNFLIDPQIDAKVLYTIAEKAESEVILIEAPP